jgi:BirA family biotin operon repressor/biotin-[acetyl-CoA-carboxylase] ligase
VSFLASLTLAGILHEVFGIEARVKWPNDILVDERKIAGMLSELEAEADRVAFINIGIGINVNNDPAPIAPETTSLKRLLGRAVSIKDVLSRYLNAFEHRMQTTAFDRIIAEWKQYTVTLNRDVRVVTTHEVIEGKAVDVDDTGALILKCADGSLKKILYGDCFHEN